MGGCGCLAAAAGRGCCCGAADQAAAENAEGLGLERWVRVLRGVELRGCTRGAGRLGGLHLKVDSVSHIRGKCRLDWATQPYACLGGREGKEAPEGPALIGEPAYIPGQKADKSGAISAAAAVLTALGWVRVGRASYPGLKRKVVPGGNRDSL